jgi:hypothetical protein
MALPWKNTDPFRGRARERNTGGLARGWGQWFEATPGAATGNKVSVIPGWLAEEHGRLMAQKDPAKAESARIRQSRPVRWRGRSKWPPGRTRGHFLKTHQKCA